MAILEQIHLRQVSTLQAIFLFNLTWQIMVLVLLVSRQSSGQIPAIGGTCPDKAPAHSIDMRQLTGQWYEVETSPMFSEWMLTCISIKVSSFFEKRSQIKIEAINHDSDPMEPETIAVLNISISHTNNGEDGKLHLSLIPGSNVSRFEVEQYVKDLYVLDTDYKNWALIWSCRSYHPTNARAELLWIVSRQRTLSTDHYKEVKEAVRKLNLESIATVETTQTGCNRGDANKEQVHNDLWEP